MNRILTISDIHGCALVTPSLDFKPFPLCPPLFPDNGSDNGSDNGLNNVRTS